jgi:glycosyltransferase involved in cell wall biosynthesis
MDVVMAALRVEVRAVPVSVWLNVSEWSGWAAYDNVTTALARGGPHVNATVQGPDCLNGIHGLLPDAVAFDPTRARDARPLKTPNETLLADSVSVFWQPADCGCTGFNMEAVNHVTGLDQRLQIRAVAKEGCFCSGLPKHDDSTLRRAMKPKAGAGDERYGDDVEAATRTAIWISAVLAGQPFHWPQMNTQYPHVSPIYMTKRPYVVARVMNEIDRATDRAAIDRLNDDAQVDEVWVPAKFLIDTYRNSGLRLDRPIFVVPDGIDCDLYDPETVQPAAEISENREYDGYYKFLANSNQQYRKGYDVLYRAYFTTFTKRDKVVLLLKTYLWLDPDPHNVTRIEAHVRNFVRTNLSIAEEDMAAFAVVGGASKNVTAAAKGSKISEDSQRGATPASYMPQLYKAVDCYVLTTRGEGWGIPFQEAMAMGLPTIGTNWGGNIQFMNATNSLLVDIEGLEDPMDPHGPVISATVKDERCDRHWGDTPLFARPSWRSAAKHMRWVFDHQQEAKELGAVAREHIKRDFSRAACTQIVVDRIADIKRRIDIRNVTRFFS